MVKVKALSVHNGHAKPWASLIAMASKTIEVRSWETSHRGLLLIAATQKPEGPFNGMAACLVRLADTRPMQMLDSQFSLCDYAPGLFAWKVELLKDLRHYKFPIKGQQGLFTVTIPDLFMPLSHRDHYF